MPASKLQQPSIKVAASLIVRDLPESASWEDLMYQIFVRQKIDRGLADLQAGRKHEHKAIRQEFGLAS